MEIIVSRCLVLIYVEKKSAINKHEAEPWMQKVYFLKKYIIYNKNNEQAVFISNI